MAEHAQLGDVATEEERHRPVGDHAQLARGERKLEEMVRARHPPAGKAAEAKAEDIGDPLVAPERRHLAEHPVAIRLGRPRQVLREPSRLAQRVLGGRRVGLARRRLVRHCGAVPERPHVLASLDPEIAVDADPSALVQRQAELREQRVRAHARRPDERVRLDPLAVREGRAARVDGLERRRDADVDAASPQFLRGVLAEARRDLGQDRRCGVRRAPSVTAPSAVVDRSGARRARGRRARPAPRRPRSRRRRTRRSGGAGHPPRPSRRQPPPPPAGRGCAARSRRRDP